jgi:hypothetical protein
MPVFFSKNTKPMNVVEDNNIIIIKDDLCHINSLDSVDSNSTYENNSAYGSVSIGSDDMLLEYYKDENLMLTKRIEELELKLKKYTNGENHKRYYEKNKDKIKETGASYLQKLKKDNPEKIKEYSRTAYLNKKNKKLVEENEALRQMTILRMELES